MTDRDDVNYRWQFQTNINGDDPETLAETFEEVRELASRLQMAILKISVHGRNYQTLDATDLKYDMLEARVLNAQERGFKSDLALKQHMYKLAEQITEAATAGQLHVREQQERV